MDIGTGIRQALGMPEEPVPRLLWHDAAAVASFAPYEPIGSSERWAGGFGSAGDHLEVVALVDGVEVSVDTSLPARPSPDGVRDRNAISELLWRHTLEGHGELELPYSVRVISDDRTVMVGQTAYTAHGMRVDGSSRWVGSIRLHDVTVRIRTTSLVAPSLRPCVDSTSLSEFPPDGR